MPIPYPATESGVELRLLQHLFEPDEAEIALHMSVIEEPVGVIHRRIGTGAIELPALQSALKRLHRKGAIAGGMAERNGSRMRTYGVTPLAVGMFEMQVNCLTKDYVRDFHQYIDEGFRSAVVGPRTSQMRTVPVHTAIAGTKTVGSYGDIQAYIATSDGPFAVMNCVCRQGAELLGKSCATSSTHETCLAVGKTAVSVIVGRTGRRIRKDEVIGIIARAEREGHVLQSQNTRSPDYICCCCRDCCEILINARKVPVPADVVSASHRASVNTETCLGCEKCIKRCPMEAISLRDRIAEVAPSRCIGCGLCVTTCPNESIQLAPRDDARRPPRSVGTLHARILAERKGIASLVGTGVRRLLGKPF